MSESIIEIGYSLTEEDILHDVRIQTKVNRKDPAFRKKRQFIIGYSASAACALSLTSVFLIAPGHLNLVWLLGTTFICIAGLLRGYQGHKQYRQFYELVKKRAISGLLFRANASGFTIIQPGIGETSIFWTAVKSLNLDIDYLYIAIEGNRIWVPARHMSQEQWVALKELVNAVLPNQSLAS